MCGLPGEGVFENRTSVISKGIINLMNQSIGLQRPTDKVGHSDGTRLEFYCFQKSDKDFNHMRILWSFLRFLGFFLRFLRSLRSFQRFIRFLWFLHDFKIFWRFWDFSWDFWDNFRDLWHCLLRFLKLVSNFCQDFKISLEIFKIFRLF